MKTRMVSPGRTIGFSELPSSLMFRTRRRAVGPIVQVEIAVMTLQSNTLAS
jgi:hypothetical protein